MYWGYMLPGIAITLLHVVCLKSKYMTEYVTVGILVTYMLLGNHLAGAQVAMCSVLCDKPAGSDACEA